MGRWQKDKRNLLFFTDDHGVQGLVLLNHHQSYLCEFCENVTLFANGVNKVLKDKFPTSPHDIVETFSCSSTRHYIYELAAKSVLLLILIFKTIWK